mgnify:CR=1 FL=1
MIEENTRKWEMKNEEMNGKRRSFWVQMNDVQKSGRSFLILMIAVHFFFNERRSFERQCTDSTLALSFFISVIDNINIVKTRFEFEPYTH